MKKYILSSFPLLEKYPTAYRLVLITILILWGYTAYVIIPPAAKAVRAIPYYNEALESIEKSNEWKKEWDAKKEKQRLEKERILKNSVRKDYSDDGNWVFYYDYYSNMIYKEYIGYPGPVTPSFKSYGEFTPELSINTDIDKAAKYLIEEEVFKPLQNKYILFLLGALILPFVILKIVSYITTGK